jgi:hypothetical protein
MHHFFNSSGGPADAFAVPTAAIDLPARPIDALPRDRTV